MKACASKSSNARITSFDIETISYDRPKRILPKRSSSATQGKRHDIVPLEGENIINGLIGETLLLFASTESDKASLLASPLLGHQPAVEAKQVYSMGPETFRLDYYSAMELIERMNALFGNRNQR